MCPLYPFHVIILYLCLLLPLLFAIVEGADELAGLKVPKWNVSFLPSKVEKLQEKNFTEVQFTCQSCPLTDHDPGSLQLLLKNDQPDIAAIEFEGDQKDDEILLNLSDIGFKRDANDWNFLFNITGKFLGFTKVKAEIRNSNKVLTESVLNVSIVRKKTIQSKVFSYSVAILVSLAYINMGCAMDLEVVRETIKKPIGPLIGFLCQYLMMPLLSYALGFIFGTKSVAMRLGLFVTGTSPGGGASNIWTVMFGGNLNLSVTMTAMSTFAAFFMLPLWLFTLGATIFDEADIAIPYRKVCTYAFFLVIPLSIGLAISRWAPKLSKFLVKILKPMALCLILFIIFFGVYANLYIFQMMTWQVFLCGMGLPWFGFAFGFTIAKLLKRPTEDIIAIAIETGVQNTGMSIFILWFTLDQPAGDMTAIVPVAAATMTPLPLLAALIVMKVRDCLVQKEKLPNITGESDQDVSIIKTKKMDHEMKMEESESKVKLVANGDANENCLA